MHRHNAFVSGLYETVAYLVWLRYGSLVWTRVWTISHLTDYSTHATSAISFTYFNILWLVKPTRATMRFVRNEPFEMHPVTQGLRILGNHFLRYSIPPKCKLAKRVWEMRVSWFMSPPRECHLFKRARNELGTTWYCSKNAMHFLARSLALWVYIGNAQGSRICVSCQ